MTRLRPGHGPKGHLPPAAVNLRDTQCHRQAPAGAPTLTSATASMTWRAGAKPPLVEIYETRPRACPVDHGTGSRSQIRIDATSMVPR